MIPSGIKREEESDAAGREEYDYFLNYDTIPEALMMYADSDQTAVVCGEESVSYRDFISSARKLARALVAEGIGRGDRILLSLDRSVSSLVVLFAVLFAGASYVASESSWPEERIHYILRDSKARFILDEQKLKALQEKSREGSLPRLSGEDEFAVYYTSGSTGVPKGCVTHHRVYFNLSMPVRQNLFAHEIMEHCERCFSMINYAYIGSIWDISIALLCGKTLILATETERMNPALLGRRIYKENADALNIPPSQLLAYLSDRAFRDGIRKVRYLSMGGEALTEAAVRRLREQTATRFFQIYGASEVAVAAESRMDVHGPNCIGSTAYGARIYLLDADGHQVKAGEEGEICVGGAPAEFGYYIGSKALTAQKYTETEGLERVYHTGDRGIGRMDGTISVIGRMDNMHKLHGQRIELREIELRIEDYPGIEQAAVDIRGEEPDAKLVAWYIAEKPLDEVSIRGYLRKWLPAYMVPIRIKHMDSFPLNQNGKLDRKALPGLFPEA